MSKNLSWHQDQTSSSAETAALRAMRWFFLVLIALWIFAAMALPVIAFCFTQNLLSFSLYGSLAPPSTSCAVSFGTYFQRTTETTN